MACTFFEILGQKIVAVLIKEKVVVYENGEEARTCSNECGEEHLPAIGNNKVYFWTYFGDLIEWDLSDFKERRIMISQTEIPRSPDMTIVSDLAEMRGLRSTINFKEELQGWSEFYWSAALKLNRLAVVAGHSLYNTLTHKYVGYHNIYLLVDLACLKVVNKEYLVTLKWAGSGISSSNSQSTRPSG